MRAGRSSLATTEAELRFRSCSGSPHVFVPPSQAICEKRRRARLGPGFPLSMLRGSAGSQARCAAGGCRATPPALLKADGQSAGFDRGSHSESVELACSVRSWIATPPARGHSRAGGSDHPRAQLQTAVVREANDFRWDEIRRTYTAHHGRRRRELRTARKCRERRTESSAVQSLDLAVAAKSRRLPQRVVGLRS